jgi:hypothetical protein
MQIAAMDHKPALQKTKIRRIFIAVTFQAHLGIRAPSFGQVIAMDVSAINLPGFDLLRPYYIIELLCARRTY